MALHCAATFDLLPVGTAVGDPDDGVVVVPALAPGADVVAELQALADLHRGERVVVPVTPRQRATVLEHLGRVQPSTAQPVRLEIGDDGWALVPAPG